MTRCVVSGLFFLLSLNLPLDQSVCAVPVWPWQSFPCRWSSVAGSFRCAASHLNIKRWSCDIGRRESGWTSQCPSLNGWLTGRYAAITQERRNHELAQITCKKLTDCFDLIIYDLSSFFFFHVSLVKNWWLDKPILIIDQVLLAVHVPHFLLDLTRYVLPELSSMFGQEYPRCSRTANRNKTVT